MRFIRPLIEIALIFALIGLASKWANAADLAMPTKEQGYVLASSISTHLDNRRGGISLHSQHAGHHSQHTALTAAQINRLWREFVAWDMMGRR